MTKWRVATIAFGVLTAVFIAGSISSSNGIVGQDSLFLASASGKYGFTTTDRAGSMAFAAFICGCACLGSLAAGIRARRNATILNADRITRDSETSKWICPHCHEESPGNFEECWKCQKNRPAEMES
jgi:hypothetical protein